jgi:NitT/TauT family transport system substrate-binding protein
MSASHFPSRSTALTTFAAAVAGTAIPRIARAQASTVRIAGVFSDTFAEPFYVKDAGFFAKAGFEVDTISLNNAGAVAAAIGGGSLEMGTGDLVSGVNAINAGVPIVLVAGGGMYVERSDGHGVIIAVASDSPIRGPKDLAGKTLGVPTLVGMSTACLRSWLLGNGVSEASIRFVELPQSAALPALQRGTLDAGLLSEPFVTFGTGTVRSIGSPYDVVADRSTNKEFCISVWYANKPWFEADPARSRRAVQAIYDTARWANAHRDDTFAILVRDGKLDADKARGMLRTTYATALTPALVQPVIDVANDHKMFSKPVDAAGLITKT